MIRNCCTCFNKVEEENAAILTVGPYGTPRCLCDECSALVDTITSSTESDKIKHAMDELTSRMKSANADDPLTVDVITDIIRKGAEKVKCLDGGSYRDEPENTANGDGFDEIPDELKETEEDRLLDEKDAEAERKFNKAMNIAWIVVGALAAVLVVWKIIEKLI